MGRDRRCVFVVLVFAAVAGATDGRAQDAPATPSRRATPDASAPPVAAAPPLHDEVRPPTPAPPSTDPLAAYRADDAYRYDERPRTESWLRRLWNTVAREVLSWLSATTWSPVYGRAALGVLALALLFALSRLFARYGVGGLYRRVGTRDAAAADALPERLDGLDLDAWLRDALSDGDARRAVRAVYLRTLQHLADRRLLVYRPKATNADYLRALPPDVADALAPLSRRFEELWYGAYAPRAADADAAQRHEAAVHAAARRATPTTADADAPDASARLRVTAPQAVEDADAA